jgi:beta-lactam-binding protein with PASTA domain
VVGMAQAQATQVLVESSFTPLVVSVPSGQPAGLVVGQDPAGGATAVAGSQVVIRVSNGSTPVAGVPNVVGLTEGSATAKLRAAGFAVAASSEPTEDKKLGGTVAFQAPGPGAELPPGATVTLVVYRYEKTKGPPGGGKD